MRVRAAGPDGRRVGGRTILEWLERDRATRTTSIIDRLQAAVADGELRSDIDAQALGDAFAALLHGLSVQARDGVPRSRLRALLDPAMTMLDNASTQGPQHSPPD